jgi:hypothetical protein
MVASRRAGRSNERPMPPAECGRRPVGAFSDEMYLGNQGVLGRLGDRDRPAQSDGSRSDHSSAAGSSRDVTGAKN